MTSESGAFSVGKKKRVKIRIEGMAEVIAAVCDLPETIRQGARNGVQEAAGMIRDQAVNFATNPKIKAALYTTEYEEDGAVGASVAIDGGVVAQEGSENAPLYVFEEMGTGILANALPPKNGLEKAPLPDSAYTMHPWFWYDESGKYTKSGKPGLVYSEGQAAKPYLYPAAQITEPHIPGIIKDAVREAIRKAGK